MYYCTILNASQGLCEYPVEIKKITHFCFHVMSPSAFIVFIQNVSVGNPSLTSKSNEMKYSNTYEQLPQWLM